ncbi:MAG: GNAT family N-acetyltransferase [Pseudomonadota bacterium]
MTDEISIRLEEDGAKGRYIASIEGLPDAEMTYSRVSPKVIIVDHTGVPEDLRGKGVGAALAENIIREAREKEFKIIPLCPFLKSQFDKNPDWADVLNG